MYSENCSISVISFDRRSSDNPIENKSPLNEQNNASSTKGNMSEGKLLHIISPDFQAKHIKQLVQSLQKKNIPMRFQHETQTLGLELNQKFFVVVDNKENKTVTLGPEFSSLLMTVTSYPRQSTNKKNIYCPTPDDVWKAYEKFAGKDRKKVQGASGQKSQSSSAKHTIKLKAVCPYDEAKRCREQNSSKEQSYSYNHLQPQRQQHDLIYVESVEHSYFNDVISRVYHSTKLSAAQGQKMAYMRSDKQFFDEMAKMEVRIDAQLTESQKISNKKIFVLLHAEKCIDFVKALQGQFPLVRKSIKIIACSFESERPSLNHKPNLDVIKLVRSTYKDNIFFSYVCSAEQCQKSLSQAGFIFKKQTGFFNVPQHSDEKSQKSIRNVVSNSQSDFQKNKGNNEIVSTMSKKQQKITQKQISLKNITEVSESRTSLAMETTLGGEHKQQTHKTVQQQSQAKGKEKKKMMIPPISSILEAQKSQVSVTSRSPSKLIKITRKELSELSNVSRSAVDGQKGNKVCQVNDPKKDSNKKLESSFSEALQDSMGTQNIGKCNTIKPSFYQKNAQPKFNGQSQGKIFVEASEVSITYSLTKQEGQSQPEYAEAFKRSSSHGCCFSDKPRDRQQTVKSLNRQQETHSTQKKDKTLLKSRKGTQNTVRFVHQEKQNAISGMLYIEYNDLISSLVGRFSKDCPQTLIHRNRYRSFYLDRQYSQQTKRLWGKDRSKNVLVVLTDLQGLQQVCNYYDDVLYEDDEEQYKELFGEQAKTSMCQYMEEYSEENFDRIVESHGFAHSNPGLQLLILCVLEPGQFNDPIFDRLENLRYRMPIFQTQKYIYNSECSNCQSLKNCSPNQSEFMDKSMDEQRQMKSKSSENSIYREMIDCLKVVASEKGGNDRFVSTD